MGLRNEADAYARLDGAALDRAKQGETLITAWTEDYAAKYAEDPREGLRVLAEDFSWRYEQTATNADRYILDSQQVELLWDDGVLTYAERVSRSGGLVVEGGPHVGDGIVKIAAMWLEDPE